MPAITLRHRGGHIYMPAVKLLTNAYYLHSISASRCVYPVSIAALLIYPHITGSYVAERSKCNGQKRAVTQLHPLVRQHYNNEKH